MSKPHRAKRAGRGGDSTIFEPEIEIVRSSQPELGLFPYQVPTTYIVDYRKGATPVRPIDGLQSTLFEGEDEPISGFENHAMGFNSGYLLSIKPEEIGIVIEDTSVSYNNILNRIRDYGRAEGLILVTASMIASMRIRPAGIPESLKDGKSHIALGTIVPSKMMGGLFSPYMHWCDHAGSHVGICGENYGLNCAPIKLEHVYPRHRFLMFPRDKLHLFQDPMELQGVYDGDLEVG